MLNRIVAHFLDGSVERGYTTDFQPNKEIFHLVVKNGGDEEKSIVVKLTNLKAVFFVKDLNGRPKDHLVVKRSFDDIKNQVIHGKKVKVVFIDGEVLYGVTNGYSAQRRGFFINPIDPESNNERIFAVLTAIKEITFHN